MGQNWSEMGWKGAGQGRVEILIFFCTIGIFEVFFVGSDFFWKHATPSQAFL